ncbi:uncharacterized protein FA14DRAFT_192439 [Meira miltonrushii]|uniref:CCHC-type domain-containing protein n=1 Tax=Meira miltonrushii TaxID=1280837 RepID=A0A316V3Q7_9BASI|nr:uncharacterized protein FA14DRAFT_192439 [Meira miltonrushii]PWN32189.1 hypothetical protein FA14DRAFT_192439 [Meira miltonrushii]
MDLSEDMAFSQNNPNWYEKFWNTLTAEQKLKLEEINRLKAVFKNSYRATPVPILPLLSDITHSKRSLSDIQADLTSKRQRLGSVENGGASPDEIGSSNTKARCWTAFEPLTIEGYEEQQEWDSSKFRLPSKKNQELPDRTSRWCLEFEKPIKHPEKRIRDRLKELIELRWSKNNSDKGPLFKDENGILRIPEVNNTLRIDGHYMVDITCSTIEESYYLACKVKTIDVQAEDGKAGIRIECIDPGRCRDPQILTIMISLESNEIVPADQVPNLYYERAIYYISQDYATLFQLLGAWRPTTKWSDGTQSSARPFACFAVKMAEGIDKSKLPWDTITYKTVPNGPKILCKFNLEHVEKYNRCSKCRQLGHSFGNCPTTVCFKCNVLGHMKKDCPNKKPKYRCQNCGEEGHMKKDCPNPPEFF